MENDYAAYVERIAGEMARNGHPRLCVARGDVSKEDIADYMTVLEPAADERLPSGVPWLPGPVGAACLGHLLDEGE